MSTPQTRRWTLESAQQIFAEVRQRTERAVVAVEALEAERAGLDEEAPRRAELEQEIRRAVSRWIRAMDALGLEVKGLWLVDFDNGQGYYCWRWPEQRLEYFHGYDEGFAGRVRIQ